MQNLMNPINLVTRLDRNEIQTLTKDHKCVVNLQKWACNNPNLDLVKVNAYAKFDQFDHKILSENKILMLTKAHNCVVICENGHVTIPT